MLPSPRSLSASARCTRAAMFSSERLQHQQPHPREQRRNDFERRIFGRRADQSDQPALDVRQNRVLLRAVPSMDFVDKDHRAFAPSRSCHCRLDRRPRAIRRRPTLPRSIGNRARLLGEHTRSWSCRYRAAPTGSSNADVPAATIWLSNLPGPSRCSCPTISSSARGRIRSASGWPPGAAAGKKPSLKSDLRRAIVKTLSHGDFGRAPRNQMAHRRAIISSERRPDDRPR